MKQFSLAYITLMAVFFLEIAINCISGLPLLKIVKRAMDDNLNISPETLLGHLTTSDLMTPKRLQHVKKLFRRRMNRLSPTNEKPSGLEEIVSRSRREANDVQCELTAETPIDNIVSNLDDNDKEAFLNANAFLGLNPRQPEMPTIPPGQPDSCNGDWVWPGNTVNLKSSCPWKWTIRNLTQEFGSDIYPRYVREAQCLCDQAKGNYAKFCYNIPYEITLLTASCKNGVAVWTKMTNVTIIVGCYAGNASENPIGTTPRPTPANTPPISV